MYKPLMWILTILACLSILLSSSPTPAATFSSPNSQPIQASPQPEADSPADSPTTPPATIAATRVFLPLVSQTPTPPGTLAQPTYFTLPGGETPPLTFAYGGNALTFNPVTIPGRGEHTTGKTDRIWRHTYLCAHSRRRRGVLGRQ
jgi:hypothetical protein